MWLHSGKGWLSTHSLHFDSSFRNILQDSDIHDCFQYLCSSLHFDKVCPASHCANAPPCRKEHDARHTLCRSNRQGSHSESLYLFESIFLHFHMVNLGTSRQSVHTCCRSSRWGSGRYKSRRHCRGMSHRFCKVSCRRVTRGFDSLSL